MAEYVIDSLAISKGPNTFILDPAAVVEPILDAKADKVDGATSGNFAGLDANGNLVDSGHKHSDYLTEHQDISGKLDVSEKGAANGVAELDSAGKVPSSQLPSYVDDVLEYNTRNDFPATGESGKIYIAKDTNLSYRWSGSSYVKIASDLALGETSSTAYRGDRGKAAYDHATAKGSAFTSGFYKVATNAEGHVTSASAVEKSDITNLGIPGEIQVHDFDSLEDFPAEGEANNLYIDDDTNMVYRWDVVNEEYVPVSGSGGSSALYKIPFTIETSDWTSDSDEYKATIQNTRISPFTEELVLYDSSISNMPGNITVVKNGSTNSMIFSIDTLPSSVLNGTIYSLAAESIIIDGKLDINQGVQNAGKILEVNDEGNLALINNPFETLLTSDIIAPTFNITMNTEWTYAYANKVLATAEFRFTTPSTVSSDYVIGNIPSGYRPKIRVTSALSGAWDGANYGILIIETNGSIKLGGYGWSPDKDVFACLTWCL